LQEALIVPETTRDPSEVESQSPENGSRPCKPILRRLWPESWASRRHPLKTGLVLASRMSYFPSIIRLRQVSQSPENGSRPCKLFLTERIPYQYARESQSPENGSRPCKLVIPQGKVVIAVEGSQSPENGSRPCKGGGGFFLSSPLYRPLTPSFPPASIRLRVL